MPHFNRILITGAAERLGLQLRIGLAPLAPMIRLADREPLGPLAAMKKRRSLTLRIWKRRSPRRRDAMPSSILAARRPSANGRSPRSSIRDFYYIYEGARKHGIRRIVCASSVHAIGLHEIGAHIPVDAPVRPDCLYGVGKTFVSCI